MRRSLPLALLFRLSERYCLSLPRVQFGKLHYRYLRRDTFLAVAHNTGNYDTLVSLFCSARALSYKCGLRMSPRRFVTLITPLVAYIFQTDASASGWGITCATNVSCSLGSRNRCTVILIPKCLGKIEADQAKGILVVPARAIQA